MSRRPAVLVPGLALLLAVGLVLPAAVWAAEPPSILLIVIDTLRADAVSAYGEVEGTTPELDALAREGLLYRNAYAPAPWTVPSHATLLTGLRVDQHRVGMPGRIQLPVELVTLAERLASAGYETVGISENPSVSDAFRMLQGFDTRESTHLNDNGQTIRIDAEREIERWLSARTPDRPFFAFVNLIDPHQPYELRRPNRFVPKDAPRSLVDSRTPRPNKLSCGGLPEPRQLEILYGLYLGDVHEADARLGRIVRAIRSRGGAARLLVLATSDHGEYFGEDRMMGHLYGLHDAVLRVPLIVHGLENATPAVLTRTVGLVDVAPTLLRSAGLEPPEEMAGEPLPQQPENGEVGKHPVFAAYSDAGPWVPRRWREVTRAAAPIGMRNIDPFNINANRDFCTAADPVWGGMATWIEYPYKFRWFERYPPALYDLSWDPKERSNQAKLQPELVERFTRALEPHLQAAGLRGGAEHEVEPVPDEAARALRELGYID